MNLGANAAATGSVQLVSSDIWKHLEQEFGVSGDAPLVERGLAQAIDERAAGVYGATIEPVLPNGAAVVGLGAYGRRELFPYSDVHVLIVLENESSWVALRDVLSEFVHELWDLGLRVNHAVRTIAECLDLREDNQELRFGLLDQRFVAGDARVHEQLKSRLPAFLAKHAGRLCQDLIRQERLRHARHQNTIRHLQPDVQEAPGGLRDVQWMGWLARLNQEPKSLDERVMEAAGFLGTTQCFLHYRSRSGRNLLDFEAQEKIASQPYSLQRSRIDWMRQYYEHAQVIWSEACRAAEAYEKSESSLLGNFREWRSRLSNTDFTVSRDRLLLRNPSQLESDPGLALRLIEFMARHDIRPSSDTERRLEAARPALAARCAEPGPLWPALRNILALPHAAAALRTAESSGLLTAVLPEWKHIEYLSIPGSGHRYTVDEHVLMAAERIEELRAATDAGRQRYSLLLAEIDNPALLLYALLYHDIGKDAGDGNPVEVSVARAAGAARRIEMPPEEQSDVEFLIEHQLDLAEATSGRDIGDPATARWLAKGIGTIERLRLLTLLTYADISAVSPDAMSPWRMDQLWQIYQFTRQELTRELETDRIQEVPQTLPRHAEFIKGFPVRYLRVHLPAEIEVHLELFERSRPTGVAVQLERVQGAYRLTVVARDMPFLFASLAGALSSFGMDILKAEAFSNSKGLILDTFVFADAKRTLDLNPGEAERLQELIRRVALGKAEGPRRLRPQTPAEAKRRSADAQVNFDSNACETATLVEISADDRPGLLHRLSTVFSSAGCNIDVVLIDTKGHRAMDVFYVAYEGRKLPAELQATLKAKLLAEC